MKLVRKMLVTLMGLSFCASFSEAYITDAQINQDNFSVEESRNFNFVSQDGLSTTVMSTAQVSEQFDCPPLFSNSPYDDIINSIEGLQNSINIFPKCSADDRAGDQMTKSSSDLRQKIIMAKSLQEKGEIRKLGISVDDILSSATKLQDVISKVSTSSAGDCYKSEDSKKLIFALNDTFQSIAPLALEVAAKNPSLAAVVAPYLPLVAGAQAISKGLSVLELAMKYVPTLDMSVAENRVAVLKNTCAFMKVYNKVEFLTLDRASRLKKINQDFDLKIKISREIKKSVIESLGNLTLSSNPVDAEVVRVKSNVEKYQQLLGKAADELAYSNSNPSKIALCSVVKTLYALKLSQNVMGDMTKLAGVLQKSDQIAFKKTKLEEFEIEINKPNTLKQTDLCADVGQEWIQAQKESIAEIKLLLNDYDSSMQVSAQESAAKIKISREDKKTADLIANKAKLNIFADLSVFEPGELGKRMRGMPKYLFNGPDGSWFTKLKKNGPVYDLLHDNETSFQMALDVFNNQLNYFKGFEQTMTSKDEAKSISKSSLQVNDHYKLLSQNMNELTHFSSLYLPRGSYEFNQFCARSKLAIKSYVEATDHLISSEYLCKMIDPVLKEASVSMWLKRYCQNSKGLVTNSDVKAGYKELARPLFVKNGPKFQIELIMQKYDQLNCD